MPTATRRQARETGRNSMTSKLQQKLSVPFSTSGPTSRPHPSTGPGAHTARRHPKHLEHYAAVFTPEANCHEDTLYFYMLNCETLPYPPWSTRAMLGGRGGHWQRHRHNHNTVMKCLSDSLHCSLQSTKYL